MRKMFFVRPIFFFVSVVASAIFLNLPAAGEGSGHVVSLTEEQQQSPLIQKILVSTKVLDQTVNVVGTMASDPDRVTQFHPAVSGRVKKILVGVGDFVRKGQVVAYSEDGQPVRLTQGGTIIGLYSHSGDWLDPILPFLTLADTSQMRCIFDVFEKQIGPIRKGQGVSLKVEAYPEEVFYGRINYISPRVNENSRTIKVSAGVNNPSGHLKFGMFANGKIKLSSSPALVIPKSAIQDIDNRTSVFLFQDPKTVVVQPIETGLNIDSLVEVKSGLKEGDRIIGEGSFILKSALSASP